MNRAMASHRKSSSIPALGATVALCVFGIPQISMGGGGAPAWCTATPATGTSSACDRPSRRGEDPGHHNTWEPPGDTSKWGESYDGDDNQKNFGKWDRC